MTKRDKIKYLVKEYALIFGVGSREWEEIYIKQDSIANKIDRKCFIVIANAREVLGEGFKEE